MNEAYLDVLRGDGVVASFVGRVAGVEVDTDRQATVRRLEPFHREVVDEMGFGWGDLWRAEQVHGGKVAVVGARGESEFSSEFELESGVIRGVDGLVTNVAGVVLGIYVADCGAVYLLDRKTGAIGLVHSGKKGTELGIVVEALRVMGVEYGTMAEDVVAVLAPCIRPPAYEVDFAAEIRRSLEAAGVAEVVDCGINTAEDLEACYSYRVEQGATGRMLALLGVRV